jgi:glycosyltransferase involved in cell wall biosynthesis
MSRALQPGRPHAPAARKVLFFTTGMTRGGAERVLATLANGLHERGVSVVVVMLKGRESEYPLADGVVLRSAELAPGLRNLVRAARFYRRVVAEEAPGVVASFSTKSDLIALLARMLWKVPGRLVVSERADPFSRDRTMQLACDVLYPLADAVVCQSVRVAEHYSRRRQRGGTVVVIPNPVDAGAIGEPVTERTMTVISVGRLSPQKNHALEIEAFADIHDAQPDARLKIYGSGPLEQSLQSQIRRLGLEGVVALEGVRPDVIREERDAALFLFASDYEGFPNALMEAAATAIPVVTTDFSPGTARELITPGVNGFIVPPGDKAALVRAALEALSGALDPAGSVEAAARIRDDHALEGVLDAWAKVLDVR